MSLDFKKESNVLMLSRKSGQIIKIGHDIEVFVGGIRDGKVSLGIKAPISVEVHREEVYNTLYPEKAS